MVTGVSAVALQCVTTTMLEIFDARFGRFDGTVYRPMLPPFIDPLHFVGYRREGAQWRVISVGLSEFADKETDDPSRSGFGVELTLQLPVLDRDGDVPPAWAAALLQKLGRIVFWSNEVPADGTWLRLDQRRPWGMNGEDVRVLEPAAGFGREPRPLRFVTEDGPLRKMATGLRTGRLGHDEPAPSGGCEAWNNALVEHLDALLFVADPDLPAVETRTGRVEVLRVLGMRTAAVLDPALAERARAQFGGLMMRQIEAMRCA